MAKIAYHLNVNGMKKPFRHTSFIQYTGLGPSHSPRDAKHAPPAPHLKSGNSVAITQKNPSESFDSFEP